MFGLTYLPLGYEQITGLNVAKGLTVPPGATAAVIVCEAQDVRYRGDGVAPTATVGMPMAKGVPVEYTGTLALLQFIEQTAGAILNVSYYRSAG